MKEENLKQIHNGLLEFSDLFHQKISSILNSNISIDYCCNKNQNKALMILGRRGKITPTMLGKSLDMRKGSLTTLLDSLENMNLVFREADEKDRRKTWIYLTEEGKGYVDSQMLQYEKIITQAFDSLGDKDVDNFSNSIKTVISIMKKL
ncbi:MarR family winged helix-turn-helix transcriptional regulator [Alkaliphilus sp. B6464]|uniref:MarR family winged helix-turn-helix transcriptional regulator n=1 Tax=Alkaliphilus sp. B6464 TaxID=2731219 RepID=UPI001BAB18ED|nr:MarR family transcriptional regulator [Alkaliphilus sp. B6464]QUH20298.1 MarR family transcriptional regulator [Alkaliphilus sp. B6464]